MSDQESNNAKDGQSRAGEAGANLTVGSGCILCAHGNDLPDGEWCRACGLGMEVAASEPAELSLLGKAVKAARGGDAPVPFKGYA